MNTFQNIIVRNPEIMAGKPIIKGTHITIEIILKKLSERISIENVLEIYPHSTNNQIFASLEYVSNIIANEDLLEIS